MSGYYVLSTVKLTLKSSCPLWARAGYEASARSGKFDCKLGHVTVKKVSFFMETFVGYDIETNNPSLQIYLGGLCSRKIVFVWVL